MTVLEISGLRAGVAGKEILRGIDLTIASGEVHAVMGPNGSGKSTLSHVLMGRPGYEVLGGTVTLNGQDVLALEPWQRAEAGLFLALQYPTEVPGVSLEAMVGAALEASGRDTTDLTARLVREAERIGFDERFLVRPLNVDLSGGEKKRNETVQLAVLEPAIAILDELDSGLDVDALRALRATDRGGHQGAEPRRARDHPLRAAAPRAARGPGAHPRSGANREDRRRQPCGRARGARVRAAISTDPWSRRSSPS